MMKIFCKLTYEKISCLCVCQRLYRLEYNRLLSNYAVWIFALVHPIEKVLKHGRSALPGEMCF